MHRWLATLSLTALVLLGLECPLVGEVVILSPGSGAVVTGDVVPIGFRLAPDKFDLDTLEVTLNGEPVAVSGGPTEFSGEVGPGAPLAESNELRVRVKVLHSFLWVGARAPFTLAPPRAHARRISDASELVTGPLAHGQIGDWLLENEVARFVIQDAPRRDMWSVGQYGGNLIDAELKNRPGTDNFLEFQPSVNIETVINAQSVQVLNDGADGNAAVLESCGPDELLDFINPSTSLREFGFEPPAAADDADAPVHGCTRFSLLPGKTWVQVDTSLENLGAEELEFFVGDFVNAAGEVDPWSKSTEETISGAGVGEPLVGNLAGLSYIGFGGATGVDYALVPVPFTDGLPRSDFLTASGVTVVLHGNSIISSVFFGGPSTFVIPPGGSKTFTRYFGVGDGSGNNAVALEIEVEGLPSGEIHGCVTVGGAPAPAARVALTQRLDGAFEDLVTHFVTGDDGCYGGRVPVGTFFAAADRRGTPFEGGGATPELHEVVIADGGAVELDFALPASGRLEVHVSDGAGAPMPARITLVGFDPSPEQLIHSSAVLSALIGTQTTGVFKDPGKDGLAFGIADLVYAGADGSAGLDVEPGDYQVYVSRGFEYSLHEEPVTISAGATSELDAQLVRVLDTTGFVSSDFHVHAIESADSRISNVNRVMQFAGEGVDNIVITEHNARADVTPTIQALGLTPFVTATVGEEITTWDYGHFNGYPYVVDPTRPSGGSLDWGFQAPAGEGFPANGHFILTPAELDAKGSSGPGTTAESLVQINHIGSTFEPLKIDTSLVPPQSMLSADEKLDMRIDPTTGDLFHAFKAIEIVNGDSRGSQNAFFGGTIGVWFNLLNQGIHTTGVGVSDTHGFFNVNAGGARTFTGSPGDAPAGIDPLDVGAAVKAGRALMSQGPFVRARLIAGDGSGAEASHSFGGSTVVASAAGGVSLELHVESALYAPFDRIEIYRNQGTVPTVFRDGVPVLFRSEDPEVVLNRDADFAVDLVVVDAAVPGATRHQTDVSVPFADLVEDSWFVVAVRGSDGISRPLFPVITDSLSSAGNATLAELVDGNLGEGGVTALAVTNPLYADVDGTPGFDPPLQ